LADDLEQQRAEQIHRGKLAQPSLGFEIGELFHQACDHRIDLAEVSPCGFENGVAGFAGCARNSPRSGRHRRSHQKAVDRDAFMISRPTPVEEATAVSTVKRTIRFILVNMVLPRALLGRAGDRLWRELSPPPFRI
jgi:hypothetical protein